MFCGHKSWSRLVIFHSDSAANHFHRNYPGIFFKWFIFQESCEPSLFDRPAGVRASGISDAYWSARDDKLSGITNCAYSPLIMLHVVESLSVGWTAYAPGIFPSTDCLISSALNTRSKIATSSM